MPISKTDSKNVLNVTFQLFVINHIAFAVENHYEIKEKTKKIILL